MKRELKFAVVGHHIGYTLSPQIFTSLFERYSLPGTCTPIDLAPDSLLNEWEKLKTMDGLAVTIPYKEKIAALVDYLSDEAAIVGAVNSVKIETGRCGGYNTDVAGFLHPLAGENLDGARALIAGHGGAARAVIQALTSRYRGMQITVCGRSRERAMTAVDSLDRRCGAGAAIDGAGFDDMGAGDVYDIIVNCTPVGGAGMTNACPLPDDFAFSDCRVCYDLVYAPSRTILLERAGRAGCRTINGLAMLVRQAAESFKLWTNEDIDANAAANAILESMTPHTEEAKE